MLLAAVLVLGMVPAQAADLPDDALAAPEAAENSRSLTEAWFGSGEDFFQDLPEAASAALDSYFRVRELAAFPRGAEIMSSEVLPLSAQVKQENGAWCASFEGFQSRVGVEVTDAVITTFLDRDHVIAAQDGTVTVFVYEWTFFDYDSQSDSSVTTDVSGFGIPHKLTLRNVGGDYVIASDEYDATDLFDICTINESTYREIEEMGYTPVELADFLEDISTDAVSDGGDASVQYTMYSGYNPKKAAEYADKYVCHDCNGVDVYEEYYNSAYPNYNKVGGDCTNYVSQCVYYGGMPMVVGHAYSNDGWYFRSASDRSATWTAAPYFTSWMANNRGRLVEATDDTIFMGSPVLYNDEHVTICVGYNSAGIPIIDSHNNDRYHMIWNYRDEGTTVYETVQLTAVNAAKLAGVPQNVKVSAEDQEVTVTFSPASDADYYDVYLASEPYSWETVSHHESTTETTAVFHNVPYGRYKAFVIARPNKDEGKQSQWVEFAVAPKAPAAPLIAVSKTFAFSGLGNPVAVTWNAVENADYYVCYLTKDGKEENALTFRTNQTGVYLTKVPAGIYTCYVRAFNWADMGSERSNSGTITYYSGTLTPKASTVEGGSQYMLFEESMPWTAAKEYSLLLGGHLAAMNTAAEDAAVTELLKSGSGAWYWMGGYKNSSDDWKWVDGYSVSLNGTNANWGTEDGTAAAGPTGSGSYLMKNRQTGTWYSASNTPSGNLACAGFVCEIESDLLYVTFDANGGTASATGKYVTKDTPYGPMPTASRVGYVFKGWFTDPAEGTRVTETTFVTETAAHTLYAHWEETCAQGHNYTYTVTKTPTATRCGEVHEKCTRCSAAFDLELPALDTEHYVVKNTVDPTCAEAGSGIYTWRIRIYGDISFEAAVPKLPHVTRDSDRAPGCLERGCKEHTCIICGHVSRSSFTPALGHDWQAEMNEDTTWTYTCKRCGSSYTGLLSATVNPMPFKDVKPTSWCYSTVLWATEKGITSGTTPTTFAPNQVCNRAAVVTFLWRAAGAPEPVSTVNPFKDVKTSSYYYKAVLWAVEQNIAKGISETAFGPNNECTRGQVVTFLYRAAGEQYVKNKVNPFTDVSRYSSCYMPILWAVEAEVTKGVTPTTFEPDAPCTRAQIVTFLYNYFA